MYSHINLFIQFKEYGNIIKSARRFTFLETILYRVLKLNYFLDYIYVYASIYTSGINVLSEN